MRIAILQKQDQARRSGGQVNFLLPVLSKIAFVALHNLSARMAAAATGAS
jgi:hypothetical protein